MSKMRRYFSIALVTLFLFGCSSADGNDDNATGNTSESMRNITVQLSWIHTVEYSGLYLAQANGYFAEENLSVEFIENDGSISSSGVLAAGEVDFAVLGADEILVERENGGEIVAVATLYQRLPVAYMSLVNSNIVTPADLAGKSVLISMGRTIEYAFRAMVEQAGVDISEIEIVPREAFDESDLLNGDVDVSGVFITNQVVQMERDGVAINVLLPVDYGVDMYVNAIATTEDMIDDDARVVEGFVRAVTRGLQDAIDDPAAATTAAVELNPDLDYEGELASMNSSVPLLNPIGSQPGMMLDDTWEFMYEILRDQDILTQEQNVGDAYDLQFLNRVYES